MSGGGAFSARWPDDGAGGAGWTELFDAIAEGFASHRVLAGKIALISLATAMLYGVVMFLAVTRISADYFVSRQPAALTWRSRHPVVRALVHLVKNLVGALLLIAGLAMLLLPGQGMLTILVALMLLDFPGKRRLVLRIVRTRHVRTAIDWIRARAGRPRLILPELHETEGPSGEAG